MDSGLETAGKMRSFYIVSRRVKDIQEQKKTQQGKKARTLKRQELSPRGMGDTVSSNLWAVALAAEGWCGQRTLCFCLWM